MILLEAVSHALQALARPVRFVFVILLIMVAVVTGPFATLVQLSLPERVVYWTVSIFAAVFIFRVIFYLMDRLSDDVTGWRVIIAKAVLMGMVFSPLAYGWTVLMVPPLDAQIRPLVLFFRDVVLISLAILAARKILLTPDFMAEEKAALPVVHDGKTQPPVAAPTPEPVPEPEPEPVPQPPEPPAQLASVFDTGQTIPPFGAISRLLRRLDADASGPLIRLEALDHFVTAVTARGHYQLRMRFADAVAELDPALGLVTHRSHWVALDAVTDAARVRGRWILTMSDGAQVPVSRKFQPDVEQALAPHFALAGHRQADGAGPGQDGNGTGAQ